MIIKKEKKSVLNVGGGSKNIAIPAKYLSYEHALLDIDKDLNPDICMDSRNLINYNERKFDAVYCSHNLEHYFIYDVPIVLDGMYHVLKNNGSIHIRVPDFNSVIEALNKGMSLYDELYISVDGSSIKVIDLIFGWADMVKSSGKDYYYHKTCFTEDVLAKLILTANFKDVYVSTGNYEITAIGYKKE